MLRRGMRMQHLLKYSSVCIMWDPAFRYAPRRMTSGSGRLQLRNSNQSVMLRNEASHKTQEKPSQGRHSERNKVKPRNLVKCYVWLVVLLHELQARASWVLYYRSK